ncbi:hypothetical protein [Erwinia phage FBB1]|nr:hypothetical protein [Erwinia phage FBB1]
MQKQKLSVHEMSEVLNQPNEIDDQELENSQQAVMDMLQAQAKEKADKIIKKNHREIARLMKHAEGAVLENNFDAYKYAISKLRAIYKQPYNDEIIEAGWKTTRQQIWHILNSESKVQK